MASLSSQRAWEGGKAWRLGAKAGAIFFPAHCALAGAVSSPVEGLGSVTQPQWFPGGWHFLGNSAKGCSLKKKKKITMFNFFPTKAANQVPKMKCLCCCNPVRLSLLAQLSYRGDAALLRAPQQPHQLQGRTWTPGDVRMALGAYGWGP